MASKTKTGETSKSSSVDVQNNGAKENPWKMAPRHYAAVRLHLAGLKQKEIAEAMNLKPETISGWFKHAEMQREIERLQRDIQKSFADRVVDLTVSAMDAAKDILEMPLTEPALQPHTKIGFINDVLDRHPETSRDEQGNVGVLNVFEGIQQLSTEALVHRANQISSESSVIVESTATPVDE